MHPFTVNQGIKDTASFVRILLHRMGYRSERQKIEKPLFWKKDYKMFDCSVIDRIKSLKKFYRCTNSILRIDGRSNDMEMLRLIETHCVPLLTYSTYAMKVVHV